jgi:hypothetical protein
VRLSWRGWMVDDDRAQRLVLGPLSAAGVGAIVRAQLGEDADESFCAACWELTGGNPLLVRELLAAAREEGLSARVGSVPALQLVAPARSGPRCWLGWGGWVRTRWRWRARSRCLARAPK